MTKENFIEVGTKEFSFTILNIMPQKNLIPLTITINGLSFGTLESPTYIPSLIGNLRGLLQDPFYRNDNLTVVNFQQNLCMNGEIIDHYRLTLEETFDDFTKIGVRNKDFVFFLFKLNENPFFTYSNLNENIIYVEHVTVNSIEYALKSLMDYLTTLP